LKVTRSSKFKKDYKLAKKQKKDLGLLVDIIQKLANRENIPSKFRDHKLSGRLKDYRELHLQPDWLLIYRIDEANNELQLARLGSHSELYI
jgi:mRNA interferase YafQ